MKKIDANGDTWVLKRTPGKWWSVHLLIAGRLVPSLYTGIDEETCLQFIWTRYGGKIEPLKKEDLTDMKSVSKK